MDGKWIRKPEGSTSVVFVHGILSSGETCWQHQNGSSWPELLKSEKGLEDLGIYVFTYETGIFSGNYRLGDAVDSLKEHMHIDDLLQGRRLIFVCHSMGGIVVRKFIVERALDLINRDIEVALYLVASPSLGSSYANWLTPLAKFFGNSQADALKFSSNNAWLNDLDKEFLNLKESCKLEIKGKELIEDKFIVFRKFLRKQVVEPFSGARYFGEPFKVPRSDHFSIAKPENREAIQHRLLCKFIENMPERSQRIGTTVAVSNIWNVPHLRNKYFTGREKLLGDLRQALVSDNTAALTQAISGLGGIGKTQLATEYCYRYKKDYNVVWWIRSEEKTTLSNDYAALALRLNLPQHENPDQAVVIAAVKDWLNSNKGWLLIFDNAKDPGDIRPFILQEHTGHIVITSRKREWGEIAQDYPLTDFERDESINYLLKRTGSNDHSAANDLAEELCDFPLALAQAAGYINSAKTTIAGYSNLFKEHKAELLNRRGLDSDYPLTVATTWSLSLVQAKKLTPLAEDLLKLMAFFAPDNIPRYLLREGLEHMKSANNLAFEDAIAALQTNSLIEAVSDFLSIHWLVQFVTLEQMDITEKKEFIQTIVQLMHNTFSSLSAPPSDVRSWKKCTTLLPHAVVIISFAEKTGKISAKLGSLMNWCGMYYYGRANYKDAEPLYRRALNIYEEELGANHPDVANSLNNLAALLQYQGKYADAELMLRRALKIIEEQLGTDHPIVANSLNSLAVLLQYQGKYADAEPLSRRALKIREEQLCTDHPDIANSLHNLAGLLQDQGRYDDAELLYNRALKISEERLGADHPDVATSLNNLAGLFQAQGKYANAETLFRRALKINEEQLGANHPDVANNLNNLALLLHNQGKYAEAEPLFRRALKINEEQLGVDHPAVASNLNNLALLLHNQGKYAEAEPLFRRALKINEEQQGVDHPDVAKSLNNLAGLLYNQRKYIEAEPLFRRALKIREDQLGANHPDVANSLNNLAFLLNDQGKHADAEPLCRRALKINEEQLGANHPDVATCLNNLAGFLQAQGKYADAEPLFRRSLKIYEEQLGANHPDTIMVKKNLDVMLDEWKRHGR